MVTVKWIKLTQETLPPNDEIVWVGHYRSRACQLGYYKEFTNSMYNLNGEGIAASHWAKVVKPEAPTALDL